MESKALNRTQRVTLRRISRQYAQQLGDCRADLAEAEAKAAWFKRDCDGKSSCEEACSELRAEIDGLTSEWRKLVEAAQAQWPPKEADSSAAALPNGVRPQYVQGQLHYYAAVYTDMSNGCDEDTRVKHLGPARRSLAAAAADREKILSAITEGTAKEGPSIASAWEPWKRRW